VRNYTGHGWQGSNYSPSLTTKEIAKLIRKNLKEEFPECKFSVQCKSFSGGSEIMVALMKAPFEVFNKDFKADKNGNVYTEDSFKYAQLNEFSFSHSYDDGYNNGHYLTMEVCYEYQ